MGIIKPSTRDEVSGYSKEYLLKQYALVVSGVSGFSRKKRDLIIKRVTDIKAGISTTNTDILLQAISEFRATQMAGVRLMVVVSDLAYMDQLKIAKMENSSVSVKDGEIWIDGEVLVSFIKYRKHFPIPDDAIEKQFFITTFKTFMT